MSAPGGHPSPWRVLAAATALTAPTGAVYAFSVLLRPLEALLGLGRADLALVFAIAAAGFGMGMMLAPVLYGRLATSWLVLGCATVNTLGIALASTAEGLARLAVGYGVLFGIGGGAAYIVVQQMANHTVTARRGLVNGYIVSLLPAGAMVAAPIFGWAIRAFGVRATLGGFAATLAITGLVSAWLRSRSGGGRSSGSSRSCSSWPRPRVSWC
ncbi:MAG TPA: MFS transporter [Methylomirabilota bacterium]|nr:MFS transporter [Methylomirabilota bacterium]